jgi:predicted MFS family arabinose efflux permease
VDVPGIVSFTVAAAALTFAMIRASSDGWVSAPVLSLLAVGAVGLAAFVAIQRRSDHALLDLSLFRNGSFVGVMIAALLLNFAAFAYFTYTSIWLQSFLGLSPIAAGLTGLPLSASAFLVSAIIGRFLHTSAPGPIIGGGLLFIGGGALVSALLLGKDSSWPALVAGFAVCGIGVGLATPTLSSTAMGAVSPDRGGMAAGAVNTARQLGFAFGIAVLGSVFAARATHSLQAAGIPDPARVARALASGQAHEAIGAAPPAQRGHLVDAIHRAFASGLDAAFLVAGLAGVLAGLAALVLVRQRHAEPAAWSTESTQAAQAADPKTARAGPGTAERDAAIGP